jgi:radical SAM/Cys-rich protein
VEFTAEQVSAVEYAISLQSLFARSEELKTWLHSALARLEDDKLVELRLRWALADQDWPALEQILPLLSDEAREEGVWRYWQAIALERRGEGDSATAILAEVAGERGYYSFLAADKLGQPYAFNHQSLELEDTTAAPLRQLPAMQRIGELRFHEEEGLAHSEWFKVLQDTEDADRHQQLALLASEQGWHRMAIDAANRGRAWDALDLRFPMPYQDTFQRYASAQQVPSTELMAIARRESAFFPQARSPVGARGLMQIMPATGKQVAKSIGRKHNGSDLYEVDHNVLLGSAYYRQLLDRFDGNRVFALTAYNGGDLDRDHSLPGDPQLCEGGAVLQCGVPVPDGRYFQPVDTRGARRQLLSAGRFSYLTVETDAIMRDTRPLLLHSDFPPVRRAALHTLQVNLGYLCNLSCVHCHVNAGPQRTELMSRETVDQVLALLQQGFIQTLDLTGGAPELNPHFRYLVREARGLGVRVMDRCNLTVLFEPGQEDLAEFLAAEQVEIIASLPCYLEENVEQQRGKGVYADSIRAIRKLNSLGYGDILALNLVYNPVGPVLPPPQGALESDYRRELSGRFDIQFSELFTITNMPISRFGSVLLSQDQYVPYMQLLRDNFTADNLETLMCRNLLSVDWQGYLYDCDFNQMLDLPLLASDRQHLTDLLADPDLSGQLIATGEHCYGCTAGQGSSCGGALEG